jgi:hypothetical protein
MALPSPDKPVTSASYYKDLRPVAFSVDKDALLLRHDPAALDSIDTIVALGLGHQRTPR